MEQDKDLDKEIDTNEEVLSDLSDEVQADVNESASDALVMPESEKETEIVQSQEKIQEETFENDVIQEPVSIEDEPDEMITVRPVKFQQFEPTEPNRAMKRNLDIMQDISIHVSVELGRTKSNIKEVMDIEKGTIVELDKIAGEQVEVYANNKLIAKGEVIVIENKFGVRITSTSFPKKI